MSSSACQWISLQRFVLSCLMVLTFILIFLIYYKPDFVFHVFVLEGVHPPSPKTDSSPNSSTELKINQPHPKHQESQNESEIILLIWMWPFGHKYDLSCTGLNVAGCHLTVDKTLYPKAHGVLFHHRDINPASLPNEPRPSFQKWVWFNMESPTHTAQLPSINNLFNLTCSYRLDSHIPVPYGSLVPVNAEDESFKLPPKDKLVCWVVSNWNARHKRSQFYNELKKHITINAYGSAFHKHISDNDYSGVISSCKFYLSFENSIHKDYITEKLYKPMSFGSVPVVLGPPRRTYEEHIPGDAFIHVDDFSTPEKLAERLYYLDRNDSEYMRYFNWKKNFKVKHSEFGREHACRACSYLQSHRQNQTFNDLNKWFWG